MRNWNVNVTLELLLEYLIFFTGVYGPGIFVEIHRKLVAISPDLFADVGTMIVASTLIYCLFKRRGS